jgi:hypothetical protein
VDHQVAVAVVDLVAVEVVAAVVTVLAEAVELHQVPIQVARHPAAQALARTMEVEDTMAAVPHYHIQRALDHPLVF